MTRGAMVLNTINEDPIADPGTTVADLIASAGGDRITDANGDPEGIAVTSVDNTNGVWMFSTDGITYWSFAFPRRLDIGSE